MEKQEPKKRGRKKKDVVIDKVVKEPKKRGRKTVVKYYSSSIRNRIPTENITTNSHVICIPDLPTDSNSSNKNDNTSSILDEYLSNQNDYNGNNSDVDLRKLYESHINIRREQDEKLLNNLENNITESNVPSVPNVLNTTLSHISHIPSALKTYNEKEGYFQILDFLDYNWCNNTEICCWNCCHNFTNIPIGIPIIYDNISRKFKTRGYFCSEACMHRYLIERNILVKYKSNIIHMHSRLTGENISDSIIDLAPPREALIMFGGKLDINEYKNNFKTKIYNMIEYPMSSLREYIEEVDLANAKKANPTVFKETCDKRNVKHSKGIDQWLS